MNSHAGQFDAQTKADVRHLTRAVWRVAAIVVTLIIFFGAMFRAIHVIAQQPREVHHVDDR